MFVARMAVLAAAALCAASLAEAKTLRWASQGDALTLDPHSQNEGPTTAMNNHVYEALISRDPSLAKVPGLALSWQTIASDVWEYKLRPDVKFSDGTPFTADDVVFSYNRALAPSSDFKAYISSIKEVKAIDPLTVHIITDGPNPILPDYTTAILIMSKAWSEKHNVTKPQSFKDKEETFAVRNAMGTGPYTVKQRDPDVRTVLAKNPTYWGAKDFPNYPDELVYTPIKEPATRVAALISGQVDFVLDAPLQDIARIKQTPGLKTEETAQVRSIFLGLDMGSAELKYSDVKGKNPFADKRVRQAMYQAIDINAIKAKVMRNFSAPAGLTTAPGVHGYTKALDERLKYDVAGAKKLMADAGYPNGFGVDARLPQRPLQQRRADLPGHRRHAGADRHQDRPAGALQDAALPQAAEEGLQHVPAGLGRADARFALRLHLPLPDRGCGQESGRLELHRLQQRQDGRADRRHAEGGRPGQARQDDRRCLGAGGRRHAVPAAASSAHRLVDERQGDDPDLRQRLAQLQIFDDEVSPVALILRDARLRRAPQDRGSRV